MEISEAEIIPKGYGVAYKRFNKMTVIIYPIPFNLIVRAFRDLYFWIIKGCWKSKYEEEILKAEQRGFKHGMKMKKIFSIFIIINIIINCFAISAWDWGISPQAALEIGCECGKIFNAEKNKIEGTESAIAAYYKWESNCPNCNKIYKIGYDSDMIFRVWDVLPKD